MVKPDNTQYVVRCDDFEIPCSTQQQAERRIQQLATGLGLCKNEHFVVPQHRGPETNWQWEDYSPPA